MKKTLVYLLLVLSTNAVAQIKKGSWTIGGNLNFGTYRIYGDIEYIKAFQGRNLHFKPSIGYFISDRMAIGSQFGVELNEDDMTTNNNFLGFERSQFKSTNFRLTPFMRYYFNPKQGFKVFYELRTEGGIWASQDTRSRRVNGVLVATTGKWNYQTTFSVANSVGVNYFIAPNVAIEGALNYTYYFINQAKGDPIPIQKRAFPKVVIQPEFSMKLFINTEKKDNKVLADKYLKKGNTTYGFTGNLDFANLEFISLKPSVGYFLTDKLLIGSKLDLFYQKKYLIYAGLSPEIRFYQPLNKSLQLLLQGSIWAGVDYDISENNKGFKFYSGAVELEVGLNKFIAENLSIYGVVNSGVGSWKGNLDFKPRVRFGFQYFMTEKLKLNKK
jgi:outer membrane protein